MPGQQGFFIVVITTSGQCGGKGCPGQQAPAGKAGAAAPPVYVLLLMVLSC